MRRLILLRHAKADSPTNTPDHDRPLAPRGRRQAEAIGQYMAEHEFKPDLAIVSTARRAQETWALALPAFGGAINWKSDNRIYDAPASQLLDMVNEVDAGIHTLLLIGHNPGFERLAGYLSGSGEAQAVARLQREYPTAGLAVIEFSTGTWRDVQDASGHLACFETLATIP